MRSWRHIMLMLGGLLITAAFAKSAFEIANDGVFLVAAFDFLLISTAGLLLIYVWAWLPNATIDPEFYPRIVGWVVGGIAVMGLVTVLRILHPGVRVEFTFGARAVSLAIGSIAGVGIGVHEAQALTHAKTLEAQNEELKQKQAVEQQNEKLKQTEQRLEEAVTQLEASNERLEQFAYAASHDLQEPLRMVSSYLQLIEDRYDDELDADAKEFIAFAVDGADRMRAMIDGLLEYSRVDAQGKPFERVDLDAALDDVLADLQLKIEETNAEITREPLPTVIGDGGQLQQVFQNLVNNAIEYSDSPPRIHIAAAFQRPDWRIAVRDEGIGIDPDNASRIFGIFQRLHPVDEHAGSGIGLALCKRIIERHNGKIWVESERGVGSTFYFTLPGTSGAPSTITPFVDENLHSAQSKSNG